MTRSLQLIINSTTVCYFDIPKNQYFRLTKFRIQSLQMLDCIQYHSGLAILLLVECIQSITQHLLMNSESLIS